MTAADVAVLLDWMTVHGQAVRVLPTQRHVAAPLELQPRSLIALGEPPAVTPLSHDRTVVRLAIQEMTVRAAAFDRQAERSLQAHTPPYIPRSAERPGRFIHSVTDRGLVVGVSAGCAMRLSSCFVAESGRMPRGRSYESTVRPTPCTAHPSSHNCHSATPYSLGSLAQ